MRIVVLAGFAPSLLNFRRELMQAMVAHGHEVLAAAPRISPETEFELQQNGVSVRSVPLDRTGTNPFRDLALLRYLHNLFRREAPSVLLSYTIKPVIFGSLAAGSAKVPHVFSMVTGLGYAFLGQTWKQRATGVLAKGLYRAALGRNQRVFFQNPDDLEEFRRMRLLSHEKQAVLINGSGVNLVRFEYAPPVITPATFLLVARLYREKGIYEFVEAARIVRRRFPEARFHLVGARDSNPSAIAQQELAVWQHEKVIEHTGWVDDVRPHLRAASVFVLPSYREGTPRTVLEAMAMARPVVTTDVPGCRETVILTETGKQQRSRHERVLEGENGFLVPPKDSDALAVAMEHFIKQPGLIARMGQRSRQIAEEKYDVHKVNEVILRTMGLQ